jgi:hypothetical protein
LKIKSLRDFLSGLLFMLMGVLFALGGIGRAVGSAALPGPGFFALAVGLALAGIGLVVLFKSLTIETEAGDPVGPVAWRALLGVVLAVATFAVTVQVAGLVLATALVVLLASPAAAGQRWGDSLMLAGVLMLLGWLILGVALPVAVPMWPQLSRA